MLDGLKPGAPEFNLWQGIPAMILLALLGLLTLIAVR